MYSNLTLKQNLGLAIFHFLSVVLLIVPTTLQAQNVGIGTTNPNEKLTVIGTIKSDINSNSNAPQLEIHEDDQEFGRIKYTNTSSSQYFTLAGNPQRDSTLARFNIFNSDFGNIGSFTGHGRFGVNATNPAAAFHVNAQPNTDLMRVQINNATKFRIFSNDAIVFGANWEIPIADVVRFETPNMFIGFDGSHVPQELLEVDGTVRMKGFKMPFGQEAGHVLTSSSEGYGTWELAPTPTIIADILNSEVVDTERSGTYKQIVMDIDSTESFLFRRTNENPTVVFKGPSNNILFRTSTTEVPATGFRNVSIGEAFNGGGISGNNNVILGYHILDEYEGDDNVFIGSGAGTFGGEYSDNVFIGRSAGILIGGNSNVVIGDGAGTRVGSNGIFIGADAGPITGDYDRGGAIGYLSAHTGDDQFTIGNTATLKIGGYQPWTNLSDGRFKERVKEDIPGLQFINALRPVSYTINVNKVERFIRGDKGYEKLSGEYKSLLNQRNLNYESGFIAQEVERAAQSLGFKFNGVVAPQNDHDPYSLAYSQFVVPLVKAVQELDEKNRKLVEQNSSYELELDQLRAEMDEIRSILNNEK